MPSRWLIVGSKENYDISRDHGFTLQGIKSRHRKKAEEIQPGDSMLYYITGLMVLGGIVEVTSSYFEDDSPFWKCSSGKRQEERYPFRFHIKPVLVPSTETQFIPAASIKDKLQYLKKWPEKNWTLGFQGNVHLWPEADFQLVKGLFEQQPSN